MSYDDKGRRKWDTSELSSFAHLPDQVDKISPNDIKKFPTVSEHSFLQTRENDAIKIEDLIGKKVSNTQKLKPDEEAGFYCKTCECVLKDSTTYYDHMNGKKHNRMLGNNMKVERVSCDSVKNKLLGLKRKADTKPLNTYGN